MEQRSPWTKRKLALFALLFWHQISHQEIAPAEQKQIDIARNRRGTTGWGCASPRNNFTPTLVIASRGAHKVIIHQLV
jgi:hypothetical protein